MDTAGGDQARLAEGGRSGPLRENSVDVGCHQAREIVERAVKRENPAETGTADGQVPPFA